MLASSGPGGDERGGLSAWLLWLWGSVSVSRLSAGLGQAPAPAP